MKRNFNSKCKKIKNTYICSYVRCSEEKASVFMLIYLVLFEFLHPRIYYLIKTNMYFKMSHPAVNKGVTPWQRWRWIKALLGEASTGLYIWMMPPFCQTFQQKIKMQCIRQYLSTEYQKWYYIIKIFLTLRFSYIYSFCYLAILQ